MVPISSRSGGERLEGSLKQRGSAWGGKKGTQRSSGRHRMARRAAGRGTDYCVGTNARGSWAPYSVHLTTARLFYEISQGGRPHSGPKTFFGRGSVRQPELLRNWRGTYSRKATCGEVRDGSTPRVGGTLRKRVPPPAAARTNRLKRGRIRTFSFCRTSREDLPGSPGAL